MKPITYLSEQPIDYAIALGTCKTLDHLRLVLESYRRIASDALEAIPKNPTEFALFRAGLCKERKGQYAGEEWAEKFANILMPDVMFQVSMVASQFKVPWGCVYIRMKEEGLVVESDGIARVLEKETAN